MFCFDKLLLFAYSNFKTPFDCGAIFRKIELAVICSPTIFIIGTCKVTCNTCLCISFLYFNNINVACLWCIEIYAIKNCKELCASFVGIKCILLCSICTGEIYIAVVAVFLYTALKAVIVNASQFVFCLCGFVNSLYADVTACTCYGFLIPLAFVVERNFRNAYCIC